MSALETRVFSRLFLLQARWDPERMQGAGFAFALDPWLASVWAKEPGALRAARERHLDYFNTHPAAAWLVAGIVCRHEAAAAAATGAERAALVAKVVALKKSLGASLAGLYDSFFWGALRPLSAVAGLLTAQAADRLRFPHPLAAGAAVALLVYNVPALAARRIGFARGLAEGERAALTLASIPCQSYVSGARRAAAAGALLCLAAGVWDLAPAQKAFALAAFGGAAFLTRRGVAPLAQLGIAGLAGAAAFAAGVTP